MYSIETTTVGENDKKISQDSTVPGVYSKWTQIMSSDSKIAHFTRSPDAKKQRVQEYPTLTKVRKTVWTLPSYSIVIFKPCKLEGQDENDKADKDRCKSLR